MDFKDFRRKTMTDNAFAHKFDDCKTLEALIAAAASEGYSFTVEDVKNDTELLPEEAAFVAGGIVRDIKGAFGVRKIIG